MSSIVKIYPLFYKSVCQSWIVCEFVLENRKEVIVPPIDVQVDYPIGDSLLRCTNWTNVQKKKKRLEEIGRQLGASGFRIKTS